jgi:hypothetical protein
MASFPFHFAGLTAPLSLPCGACSGPRPTASLLHVSSHDSRCWPSHSQHIARGPIASSKPEFALSLGRICLSHQSRYKARPPARFGSESGQVGANHGAPEGPENLAAPVQPRRPSGQRVVSRQDGCSMLICSCFRQGHARSISTVLSKQTASIGRGLTASRRLHHGGAASATFMSNCVSCVCLNGRAGQGRAVPTDSTMPQCHEATCHPQRPVPDTAASYRGDVLNGFPSAAYMSDCCSAASTRAVQVL